MNPAITFSLISLVALWHAAADEPFIPEPALPGGMVLPLYPPDSPHLNRGRIHEPERYNSTRPEAERLLTTINIHNPSIEVHLVGDTGTNSGAAVIVAPGGGHKILWVGPEGYDTVPFFAEQGVSTIVLRNRLRADGYEPTTDAVRDAFQAILTVRAHAEEWGLDPAKIGIIGFSAGAELAAPTALFYDDFGGETSARPDFVGLVYPGPTPFAKGGSPTIPGDVPPSFIVSAGSGDRVHALWATEYFTAMLERGVPNLEMHIYGNGGHGGSLGERGGIPFGKWPERYLDWFRDLGFLGKPGVGTRAASDVAAFKSR